MAVLLRALRELFPVLRLRGCMLSGMIILGVLAALSEGLSISLFIPLLQNQLGTQAAGVAGRLTTPVPGNSLGAAAFVDRFKHISLHRVEAPSELQLFSALSIS
jgi:hypothetical protein